MARGQGLLPLVQGNCSQTKPNRFASEPSIWRGDFMYKYGSALECQSIVAGGCWKTSSYYFGNLALLINEWLCTDFCFFDLESSQPRIPPYCASWILWHVLIYLLGHFAYQEYSLPTPGLLEIKPQISFSDWF